MDFVLFLEDPPQSSSLTQNMFLRKNAVHYVHTNLHISSIYASMQSQVVYHHVNFGLDCLEMHLKCDLEWQIRPEVKRSNKWLYVLDMMKEQVVMTSILSVMREPRATLRNRGRKICDCTSIPMQLSDKTSYYTTIKIGEC